MTTDVLDPPRLSGLALALALSLAAHGGLAMWYFAKAPDEVLIAGGGANQALTLGDAFDDMLVEGTEIAELQPEAVTEEEAEPVKPLQQKPIEDVIQQSQTAQLTARAVDSTIEGSFVESEEPRELPLEPLAAVQPQEIQPVEQAPKETVQPEPEKPLETATEQPVEPVPLPVARPETPPEVHKPVKRTETAKVQKKETTKPAVKSGPEAGAGGQSNANAQKGGARTTGSGAEGNAAVSNYPGKVARALRRALRYPSAAKRKRITGEVYVSFTVKQSGQLSNVSVIRSSGSDILDKAALETVRRASPFPPIPPEAGRSSWPFRLPISFN
ncbi:energy transducer TonB [Roseibium litorale]|uniref:Protein TonB n=1 Tax=Roseibium litorale TaxID=2803841 RepID=A0ABR9CG66_9HYPH|nr:energy transducer TonB [Roseibium litorale]MBD8889925.1 TonB family protein [Roseibium litorale]